MLDVHILQFGGVMTAHAATRITDAITEALAEDFGEAELLLHLPGEPNVADRFIPEDDDLKPDHLRAYLRECIRLGAPAVFEMHAGNYDDGCGKIDSLHYLASKLGLSGRFIIGMHYNPDGTITAPHAQIFGSESPDDGEVYDLGDGYEPTIHITPETDLRSLPREAARLRMLSEWRPPALRAHADLKDEMTPPAEVVVLAVAA